MKSRAKVIRQKHIKQIPHYGNSKGFFVDTESLIEQKREVRNRAENREVENKL